MWADEEFCNIKHGGIYSSRWTLKRSGAKDMLLTGTEQLLGPSARNFLIEQSEETRLCETGALRKTTPAAHVT